MFDYFARLMAHGLLVEHELELAPNIQGRSRLLVLGSGIAHTPDARSAGNG